MKKYDVFISYSRKDSVFAEKVCAVFDEYKRHYKFEYFFDREAITSEHDYIKRISKSIAESQVMLFLASEHSTSSEFCLKELLFADKKKVHIHQYRIDNSELPDDIDMLLGNHHYREYKDFSIENMVREVLENSLDCVIKSLNDLSKSKEGPVTTPNEKPITVSTPAPTPAKTYKVGDYYNENGKEGVVFDVWDGGKHGKIVSLDQAELQWCTNAQYDKEIVVGTTSKTDGKTNTDRVMALAYSAEYPAFVWCRNKGKDWYLPAIDELELLLSDDSVHDAINIMLENLGFIKLYSLDDLEWYWASSEEYKTHAWSVNILGDYTFYYDKSYYGYVRAVAQF